MRRYRRRRHTGAHKSKSKIIFRILFILLTVTVLTALSFWLGTYLKQKAAIAASHMADATDTAQQTEPAKEESQKLPEGILSTSNASSLNVCAADIDPTAYTSEELDDFFGELPADYNGVSVRITSDDGSLIYASPALLKLVRISGDSTVNTQSASTKGDESDDAEAIIDVYDNIKKIINISSDKGLRTSCIFKTSDAVLKNDEASLFEKKIDRTVIAELCETGFDEIIISGLAENDIVLDFEKLSEIIDYLTFLRSVSGNTDIGIMLPSAVYLDAPTANQIENLSKYADFLAINVSAQDAYSPDEAYNTVYDSCYLLKGNFSVYNLRAVIDSDKEDISKSVYKALKDLSVGNIQFSAFIDDLSIEQTSDNADNPKDDDNSGKTNANASTKDKYENTPEN